MPSKKSENNDPLGWVLYDGACGFCSWWIPYWKKTIQKAGYDIAPLQSDWVMQKLKKHEEHINKDILLLLKDGTIIPGADAYIFGMKKVWWSSPVGYLLSLPGFRWLTWKFYKIFNRNRLFVSKVCGLTPHLKAQTNPTVRQKSRDVV